MEWKFCGDGWVNGYGRETINGDERGWKSHLRGQVGIGVISVPMQIRSLLHGTAAAALLAKKMFTIDFGNQRQWRVSCWV